MAYFPIFVDLKDKEIIVIGAGEVAYRKIETLLPFGPKITVIAKNAIKEIENLFELNKLNLKIKAFDETDIKDNVFLIIVAINDLVLQEKIAMICKNRKILVNTVDSPKYCSFIFGSIIHKKDLVIGINTSSKAPAVSKALKKHILSCLPDNIEKLIETVSSLRKVDAKTMDSTIKGFFKNERN
ncbi:MAG: precorrin-2 dehydrogenase/sirohydrochlorin ferrochelatase family protein [Minisyncoccia bacterium]